jgi:hypothetical protein
MPEPVNRVAFRIGNRTIEIPSAAARAGSRSDAESVKIATRLKRRSSSG